MDKKIVCHPRPHISKANNKSFLSMMLSRHSWLCKLILCLNIQISLFWHASFGQMDLTNCFGQAVLNLKCIFLSVRIGRLGVIPGHSLTCVSVCLSGKRWWAFLGTLACSESYACCRAPLQSHLVSTKYLSLVSVDNRSFDLITLHGKKTVIVSEGNGPWKAPFPLFSPRKQWANVTESENFQQEIEPK